MKRSWTDSCVHGIQVVHVSGAGLDLIDGAPNLVGSSGSNVRCALPVGLKTPEQLMRDPGAVRNRQGQGVFEYPSTVSHEPILDRGNDPSQPLRQHLGVLKISPTNYGDYTNAIWVVTWQGQYIYVGASRYDVELPCRSPPARFVSLTAFEGSRPLRASDITAVEIGP